MEILSETDIPNDDYKIWVVALKGGSVYGDIGNAVTVTYTN